MSTATIVDGAGEVLVVAGSMRYAIGNAWTGPVAPAAAAFHVSNHSEYSSRFSSNLLLLVWSTRLASWFQKRCTSADAVLRWSWVRWDSLYSGDAIR